MRKIRIDFCDFGTNWNKTESFLYRLLQQRFQVELCDQPDFLIYCRSCNQSHRLYSCVKICYSGESDLPDFRECDYSLAPVMCDHPRHLFYPHYLQSGVAADIIKQHDDPEKILAAKTKFCSFMVSGYNPRKNGNRVEFFRKLSRYKPVASGGRKFNNIGGPIPPGSANKIAFLKPFKFNIAYENRAFPGYATEKIFDAMTARCLPIYWGDPHINEQFNPRGFLNRADFPSDEALIEKIIELDQDDAKYLEYLRQPYFHNDRPSEYFNPARTLDFFENIFTQKIIPVAQSRRTSFFPGKLFGRWKLVKRHHWHPLDPPVA
jgi:alpha(1,3/1,4) fucosyltransferase